MSAPGRVKVAVIAPNWLGDAVMSLAVVTPLGRTPGVTVSVISRPYTARVFAGVEGVDEVVVDPDGGRVRRVGARARSLSALGADACVVLPPSFSSALAPWRARVPVRVGLSGDLRDALLTEAPPTPERGSEHLAETYAALCRRTLTALGRPAPLSPEPPRLGVFDADRSAVRELRRALGVGERPYAVVAPGATYGPAKSWPASRFREAVRAISKEISVVLAGGARERELCDAVGDGIAGVANAAGRTSPGAFFALLSGADVLLANDSGTPHAAAALGVPVVVLFGSTSPEWTRPLGDAVTVLRHRVHCSPCFRRTCPTQLECFAGIAVDDAVAAVRSALGRKKEVAPAHRGR